MGEPESRARRLLRRLVGAPGAAPVELADAVALSGTAALAAAATLTGSVRAHDAAEALGRSLGGTRCVVELGAAELDRALPALRQAARLRAPLVVHLTLGWDDDDPLGAVAASGALVLMPRDPQEALELALAACRISEELLLPTVVALDPRLTVTVAGVRPPTREAVAAWLGEAADTVPAVGLDQELLLGRQRRRLPRWHDPERPLRLGGALPAAAALAKVASERLFTQGATAGRTEAVLADLSRLTGTARPPLEAHRVDDARLVLLATGSDAGVAIAVADLLRRREKLRVGVLTLRAVAPLPAGALAEALGGRPVAIVLERLPAAAGAAPPLLGRVRQALAEATEDRLAVLDLPILGAAGHAGLSTGAVAELARQAVSSPRPFVWLGLDVQPTRLPKRQARQDRLSRDFPDLASTIAGPPAPLTGTLPADAVVLGITADPEVVEALCPLLLELRGGHLVAFPDRDAGGWLVVTSAEALSDPGEDLLADLVVWTRDGRPPADLADRTAEGGSLLLAGDPEVLPGQLIESIGSRKLRLFALAAGPTTAPAGERILGAVLRLLEQTGHLDASQRRILAARREALVGLGEAEREIRLAALTAGQAGLTQVDPARLRAAPVDPQVSPPAWVRTGGADRPGLAQLTSFWDQVALPWRQAGEALSPDPLLATGAVPASTAVLAPPPEDERSLPLVAAELCNGCGSCWTACPHGALTARALTPAALLDEAIRRSGENGTPADALRILASKLAARLPVQLGEASPAGGDIGVALDRAFESARSAVPAARQEAVGLAFAAVRAELTDLAASRTAPFFDDPEAVRPGTGELLFLSPDPDTCTACGLCVAVCEPGALHRAAGPERPGRRQHHRRVATLPSGVVEDGAGVPRPTLDELAGDLLDPVAERLLAGHDGAEPGSGERLAVRLLLGATAVRRQRARRGLLAEIGDLRDRLATAIHEELGRALPDRDLAALAGGLDRLAGEAPLAELAGRIESAIGGQRVDVVRLRRLVAAARAVADLEWRLTEGEAGGGRAPVSLVLGPGLGGGWAAAFPWNPFAVPATVASTGPAAVARGLATAERDGALSEARTLRQARLELDQPSEAPWAGERLARLAWSDLTLEERALATPVILLVAEDADLAGLGELLTLLAGDLPVKAVLLTGLGLAAAGPDPALLALAVPGLAFAQTALGHPEHLSAAAELLAADGTALVRIHTPSPQRHGHLPETTLERARQAVATRLFPLVLRPAGEPPDLSGNPQPAGAWPAGTPATWAAGETRFAALLTPPEAADAPTVGLEEWLDLPPAERVAVTPIVSVEGSPLAVAPALATAVLGHRESWRALCRLAAPDGAAAADVAAADDLGQRPTEAFAVSRTDATAERSEIGREVRREAALRLKGRLLAAVLRQPTGGPR